MVDIGFPRGQIADCRDNMDNMSKRRRCRAVDDKNRGVLNVVILNSNTTPQDV